MANSQPPAKQATLLVVLAVGGLAALLLVALVEAAGYLGVALFVGLVGGLVLLAALAGLSLEVAFEVVAYGVGIVRTALVRMSRRFGR